MLNPFRWLFPKRKWVDPYPAPMYETRVEAGTWIATGSEFCFGDGTGKVTVVRVDHLGGKTVQEILASDLGGAGGVGIQCEKRGKLLDSWP